MAGTPHFTHSASTLKILSVMTIENTKDDWYLIQRTWYWTLDISLQGGIRKPEFTRYHTLKTHNLTSAQLCKTLQLYQSVEDESMKKKLTTANHDYL